MVLHHCAAQIERSFPAAIRRARPAVTTGRTNGNDGCVSADAANFPGLRHDLDHVIKLLTAAKPDCSDLLWKHYVIGLDYAEIAEERQLNYDAVRMKIGRCLEEARSLVT